MSGKKAARDEDTNFTNPHKQMRKEKDGITCTSYSLRTAER